jgi:hypothetical protein
MTFSHPQTSDSTQVAPAATTENPTTRRENAYGSLFLEPDLPVGTDDSDIADYDEPEFIEPTREVSRPRRNQNGRNDARRTNRRRTAA